MTPHDPRDHHYAPQFFLRNFAVDKAKKRITTVGKSGSMAVWKERSIQNLGLERDLYVHMEGGVPVSVEADINRRIETPISQSDTWAKITAGRADALDRSDKPILYALIRHLEARTPHYRATLNELAQMAADPESAIPFTDAEREMYAVLRANPDLATAMHNHMAATAKWTERGFRGALMTIVRSPIALRSSTTPVFAAPAPEHPALRLPLPGMSPYQLILTLNPTAACLMLGDFDDAFANVEIDVQTARGLNRHFIGQFAKFDRVRHLITDRDGLAAEMTWAPYDLVEDAERRLKFRRRS